MSKLMEFFFYHLTFFNIIIVVVLDKLNTFCGWQLEACKLHANLNYFNYIKSMFHLLLNCFL